MAHQKRAHICSGCKTPHATPQQLQLHATSDTYDVCISVQQYLGCGVQSHTQEAAQKQERTGVSMMKDGGLKG